MGARVPAGIPGRNPAYLTGERKKMVLVLAVSLGADEGV